MRIFLFLPLVMLLLSSCFVSSSLHFSEADIHDGVNLVKNPGFAPYALEGNEALRGWTVMVEPHADDFDKILIDAREFSEGNSSLKISASERDVMIISEPFEVRRYGGYYARIKSKSDSENPPEIQLRMITFKPQGKVTNRFKKKLIPTESWENAALSAGFLKPGVGFGRLFIHIPPFSDGAVWLDDAGCWEVHGFRID